MHVGTSESNTLPPAARRYEGILAPPYRAATLGMVALISLIAFEALAVTTAMPTVARELNGLRAYALAFGGVLATSVIGMTLSGRWSDSKGPAPALWSGLAGFVAGLVIAGFARDMPMLLIGRLVQGLGAGCLSPALYVIVARLYPEALRPKVFAVVLRRLGGPCLDRPGRQRCDRRARGLALGILGRSPACPARCRRAARRPSLTRAAERRPSRSGPAAWLNAIGASLGTCLLFVAGQEKGWVCRGALRSRRRLAGGMRTSPPSHRHVARRAGTSCGHRPAWRRCFGVLRYRGVPPSGLLTGTWPVADVVGTRDQRRCDRLVLGLLVPGPLREDVAPVAVESRHSD